MADVDGNLKKGLKQCKKRIKVCGIGALMLLATILLGGCSAGENEESEGWFVWKNQTGQDNDFPKAQQEEITEIVMTYQTIQESVTDDLALVEEAVNDITMPEIGVKVSFKVVDATEALIQYPLWINKGDQIDLIVLNNQDINTYIGRHMLMPLDDYLKVEGEGILKLIEEGNYITEGALSKGQTYGVRAVSDSPGGGMGLWIPKRLVEETGFAYEEKKVYSMGELTEFFNACKKLYPDKYPLGQITSSLTYSMVNYYYSDLDSLGSSLLTGVLEKEGGRVADLFETEIYKEYITWLRRWYEAGYLYPDTAFTDSYSAELIGAGIVQSYPFTSMPNDWMDTVFGEETVCIRTTELSISHGNSKSGFWVIPVTSKAPEAAVRFLNLMMTDERISNLLQYGIKSKHYVVLDHTLGIIDYPYGVSRKSTGYYNPLGLYGDRREMYTFDKKEILEKKKEYKEEVIKKRIPFRDFQYDTEEVNGEIAAVQKVLNKYLPVLESGSADVTECYNAFIRELKLAGMDKIIADKQKQYEKWLSLKP